MREIEMIDQIPNRKKIKIISIIKLIIFMLIVIGLTLFFAKYIINSEFRNGINNFIFNREIKENTLKTIEIDAENKNEVYVFDNYVAILDKSNLTIYDELGNEHSKIAMSLINPIECSNGKYIAIAEGDGNRIYLINELGIKWENVTLENIYRIDVNENGYVTVLASNSTYESIVIIYDNEGNELFKTYLATSYAVCAKVSNNNEYLAIGQIDYSGTVIKSVVKLFSINKAKSNSKDALLNQYESESNAILTNISFNSKDEAICMFNSFVERITNKECEKIYDITDNDVFVDITLENNIVITQRESTGMFSYEYQINLLNTIGKSNSLYILENEVPKKMTISKDLICINLSNELKIVNSSGWLLKEYSIEKDIQDILIGDKIIVLVYNNNIKIINL